MWVVCGVFVVYMSLGREVLGGHTITKTGWGCISIRWPKIETRIESRVLLHQMIPRVAPLEGGGELDDALGGGRGGGWPWCSRGMPRRGEFQDGIIISRKLVPGVCSKTPATFPTAGTPLTLSSASSSTALPSGSPGGWVVAGPTIQREGKKMNVKKAAPDLSNRDRRGAELPGFLCDAFQGKSR